MVPEIELDLLGSMSIRRGGEERNLPSSRKTRALLAYLAVTARPERREHLCDLFWEVPDDPRGALRWSLSKLRPLVDSVDVKRLQADRETVQLELPEESVDWWRLKTLVRSGITEATTEALQAVAKYSGTFLEGLDLSGCDEFNAWCIAHREDARQWRISVLDELTLRPIERLEAIDLARSWTVLDPLATKPWERLVQLLVESKRANEAEQQRSLAIKVLSDAGIAIPASLRVARTGVAAGGSTTDAKEPATGAGVLEQKVRFCRSDDGSGLAYSLIGDGFPLIRAGYWMNHLERDLTSPVWRPWIETFSSNHALLRYDTRGIGLSDRGVEIDIERFVEDLSAVVDSAELESFDLYGMAQGAVTAVIYAARNPRRVRRLILQSSYVTGWMRRNDDLEIERRKAMITLATSGWNHNNQALRRMFAGLYVPSADEEQRLWFETFLQSLMAHPDTDRFQRVLGEVDIRSSAEQVIAPTLVLHSRGEMPIPLTAGRETATLIPGARLVTLDTASHVVVPNDPAWPRMVEAIEEFLG